MKIFQRPSMCSTSLESSQLQPIMNSMHALRPALGYRIKLRYFTLTRANAVHILSDFIIVCGNSAIVCHQYEMNALILMRRCNEGATVQSAE
jgi:hypothetical protein